MTSSEIRADLSAADRADTARPVVLLVDTEPAIGALLAEWLAGVGVDAVTAPGAADAVDLVIADVPFPRRDGGRRLRAIADRRPGTPVLVLSPTIFAGVASGGAVARQLGVAGVLATPVRRETLVGAVSELLQQRR